MSKQRRQRGRKDIAAELEGIVIDDEADMAEFVRYLNERDDDDLIDGAPFPEERLYVSSYYEMCDFFGGRRIYDQVVKELGFDPLP